MKPTRPNKTNVARGFMPPPSRQKAAIVPLPSRRGDSPGHLARVGSPRDTTSRVSRRIRSSCARASSLMFKSDLLQGKRILVTGGGTGLGREIAEKDLELGASLYLCGRRKQVLDETAAALIAKHGGAVNTHAVDIRDAAAVDAMAQWIWDDGGPLDGLVNNAAGNFVSRT